MNKREYADANRRWLEEKAAEEGVNALPGGIYYKVISQGNDDGKHPTRRSIVTAQVELGKRGFQQNGMPVAGNQVGEQRRLGIAQVRTGIGGIDSNRHGPPLKPFAIINASILPAHADRFAPRQQI